MIRVGTAPVSWGIFEFDGLRPRFTPDQVLDQMVETGYVGTELGPFGFLPTGPADLKSALERRGLQLLSAFLPVRFADPDSQAAGLASALQVGRLLAALGAEKLVLADDNGHTPDLVARAGRRTGSSLDGQEWAAYGRAVDHIADRVRDELGLEVVFHHHCAGHVETPEETAQLLDSSRVGLCLDTGHWQYAGGELADCLRRFGSRIRYVHLKDCDDRLAQRCRREQLDYFQAVAAGVFCPLGEGGVDFPALLSELARIGYDGWAVVEQDVLGDDLEAPRRCSQANRDYLKGFGL